MEQRCPCRISELFHELDAQFTIESEDETVLTPVQRAVVSLLLPENVVSAKLIKLGKGWSAALKFLVIPSVLQHGTMATGAVTFVKLGDEDEVEEEAEITRHMMQLLGNFCPQILGYSEHQKVAALHLSLADLGDARPKGFADLYADLVSLEKGTCGTLTGGKVQARLLSCIDFVFNTLIIRLHNSKSEQLVHLNVMDELGFSKDVNGLEGLDDNLMLASGWVLEKLWRKQPGDGTLAGSVSIHIAQIFGEDAPSRPELTFLHRSYPNMFLTLLQDKEPARTKLNKMRAMSEFSLEQCYVHGDLHGDNIMVDSVDNRFLIDFGKTGLGHSLEDVTWLESFVLLSYTDLANDEEYADALDLIDALAPPRGLSSKSCDLQSMEFVFSEGRPSKKKDVPLQPRIHAMWNIVKQLRLYMGKTMVACSKGGMSSTVTGASDEGEAKNEAMLASLLLLRNCLFFMSARENKDAPRRRQFSLALACAYTRSLLATCKC